MPLIKQDPGPSNSTNLATLYLLILVVGGIILVTKPVLVVLAILIVGYGRIYHVQLEPAKKSRMPWSSQHEPPGYVIRAGPSQQGKHHDTGFQLRDLGRSLQGHNVPLFAGEKKARISI